VDSENQIILADETTAAANDKQQAVPLAQTPWPTWPRPASRCTSLVRSYSYGADAVANLAAAGIERPRDEQGQPRPIPNTADPGYYSAENVQGVTEAGLDPYFAVRRDKHHAPQAGPLAAASSDSANAARTPPNSGGTTNENPKAAMAKKLRTPTGRALYAARKHIVEPVFGQIKRIRGFRKFLLRGLELVSAEWQLICLTHKILHPAVVANESTDSPILVFFGALKFAGPDAP
jgi:hypothetical protein